MMLTPPHPLARRHRGMTLVEVLATLVLVAIVLPVAMQGVTLSLRAASFARHSAEAAQLAEIKINELLVVSDASQLTGGGDFGPAAPDYRWTAESISRDFGTYEVAVTVFWTERGRERSVTLATIVHPTAQVL